MLGSILSHVRRETSDTTTRQTTGATSLSRFSTRVTAGCRTLVGVPQRLKEMATQKKKTEKPGLDVNKAGVVTNKPIRQTTSSFCYPGSSGKSQVQPDSAFQKQINSAQSTFPLLDRPPVGGSFSMRLEDILEDIIGSNDALPLAKRYQKDLKQQMEDLEQQMEDSEQHVKDLKQYVEDSKQLHMDLQQNERERQRLICLSKDMEDRLKLLQSKTSEFLSSNKPRLAKHSFNDSIKT